MYRLQTEVEKSFINAARRIEHNLLYIPKTAVIAGSGIMRSLADLEIIQKIEYSETGILPETTVPGHQKEILIARHKDKDMMIFTGRYHLYEGYSPLQTAYPVILAYALGVKNLVLTNAAGGVNINYFPGDIMIINDIQVLTQNRYYFNFSLNAHADNFHNALPIDKGWTDKIASYMTNKKTAFREGTYAQVTGPNYETRAEIRMLRKFGADAVGMSTGIEANFASMLGIKCVACSLITNKASEVPIKQTSHEEVLDMADQASFKMKQFIFAAIDTK